MSDLKYENKKYLGKKFVKEGTGAKGEWKLYKLIFDKPDSEYDQEIKAFSPLGTGSIQIEALEDGKEYNVGYVEEDYKHPDYGMIKTKTVRFITDKKEVVEEEKATIVEIKPEDKVVLTGTETEIYNKAVLELENSFIDTMKAETGCTEERAKKIWDKIYIPSMRRN